LSQTITTSVTDVNTQVNASLTALQAAVSKASDQAVATSQTTLQSIPSQVKQVSEQLMQDTQQVMIAHQRQLNRLYRLRLTAWVVTVLAIFAAIGLFGYHYYLSKQVFQAQQQLDTLQQYIDQTPLQIKALSMVNISATQDKRGAVLLIPKNQLTADWWISPTGEKILLVTPSTPTQQNKSFKQK
jgi:hemin uptake protein HemP